MPETRNKHRQRTIHVSTTMRLVENAHILLWLIKDFCWAMEWKQGGVFMIFPTVSVAFYLLRKTRKVRAELYHNLAVCFWILANSTWMVGEFIDNDFRIYAASLFGCGLMVLAVYYAFYFKKDRSTYRME